MRNSRFLKSTNTNSQTLCNSEEQQHSENCTFQLAPVAPKEETTETLNWNTFSIAKAYTLEFISRFLLISFNCCFTKSNHLGAVPCWQQRPTILLLTKPHSSLPMLLSFNRLKFNQFFFTLEINLTWRSKDTRHFWSLYPLRSKDAFQPRQKRNAKKQGSNSNLYTWVKGNRLDLLEH